MRLACCVSLSALLFPASQAIADSSVAAGVGYDWLSNNFDSWQHQYVRGHHRSSERSRWRGEMRNYQRYGLTNTELSTGLTYQLAARRSADVEVSYTPGAEFRPQQRYTAQLYQGLWQAGGVTIGAQHSNWATNNSRSLFIEPDYYYGPFRFAARYNWVDLDQVGSSSGYGLSAAWYYGERSHTTLSFADGREIEPIGENILISTVRAVALFGRHHIRQRWSLEYAVSYTEQGTFYNRTGVELGVHYQF